MLGNTPIWHQLFLFTVIWVMFCSKLCSRYWLFSYLLFTVLTMLLLYTHIMHVHTSLNLHTCLKFSDSPGFVHPDIGCFVLLIRCSMRSYALRRARVFLCWLSVLLSFLLFLLFHDSLYIIISWLFHLCVYLSSCVDIYMYYCSDRDLLKFICVACFMLLKV